MNRLQLALNVVGETREFFILLCWIGYVTIINKVAKQDKSHDVPCVYTVPSQRLVGSVVVVSVT